MESITQFQPAPPSRRPNKPLPNMGVETTPPTRAKKLPKVAVEATADAFMAIFAALPGTVKGRIMQKTGESEDEFDAQEFAAARVAADKNASEKGIPFDQVMAEYEALHQVKL